MFLWAVAVEPDVFDFSAILCFKEFKSNLSVKFIGKVTLEKAITGDYDNLRAFNFLI